jgi:hypothetical protein
MSKTHFVSEIAAGDVFVWFSLALINIVFDFDWSFETDTTLTTGIVHYDRANATWIALNPRWVYMLVLLLLFCVEYAKTQYKTLILNTHSATEDIIEDLIEDLDVRKKLRPFLDVLKEHAATWSHMK